MKALFELHSVRTSDGITLAGAIARPRRRSKTAALWVHGLTGSFSSSTARLSAIAAALNKKGIALASFNNRGHDIMTSFWRKGRRGKVLVAGGSFERFADCVKDMKAIIQFLRREGYEKIYLIGHSTGANKSLYYLSRTGDRRVKGLALVGPMNDLAIEKERLGRSFAKHLDRVREYSRKNDPDQPMPKDMSKVTMSARRYLSLHTPGSPEDVFPYYNPKASWTAMKKIRVPLAVIIGRKDQHLGKWRAEDLIDLFAEKATAAPEFTGAAIPRSNHSFTKTGRELAEVLADWIAGVNPKA